MANLITLSLLVVLQVLGNSLLSHGIRQLGEVKNIANPLVLVPFAFQVLTNPWVILGIVCLIAALLLYLAAVSRLDLSYVLPMIASSYVLTTLSAWLFLGEQVAVTRWAGTLLVTIGIALVGFSENRRRRQRSSKR
ncbi:EamA family transporter [Leptolyngbya sp. FACHB-261]|uniref:EamA family transporter n=1 Tax=Leptolyngbya sp. FACHB-261 TaxID=2692806 RepID=UPI0016857AA6|nr:EamA family transporter [Leptolyngbya sp. FACHB-261]MBD2101926.1 EamA family transporter [Leptolyngbya sp. FACHB-261]